MVIITGGAGFIGSALAWKLNTIGIDDILIVDSLGRSEKWRNLSTLSFNDYIDKEDFRKRLLTDNLPKTVDTVLHMGACSATTERDAAYLMDNNYRYTAQIAEWCLANNARLIYASSAATYGDGSLGFSDDHALLSKLRPLNAYGYSKQLFDLHALRQGWLERIAGLKFFNVFGPNEYHKGDMRSVVHKFFPDVRTGKTVRLFKSHRPEFKDGMQKRDFIYVKDVANIVRFFMENRDKCGIYNVGTGHPETFRSLVESMYTAAGTRAKIRYRSMPDHLRDRYQYFTCADIGKLRAAGYDKEMTPCRAAVDDYINNHLLVKNPYLGNGT